MAFMASAVMTGGMAGLGAIGGAMKSGNALNQYGRGESQKAYDAYRNLVSKGAGEADVTTAYNSQKDYANLLGNTASSGLYDMAAGNRLAEQQFAPQRQALQQSMQDQMALANRAAAGAGRSSNDPILRARLGAEAMRSNASLNSQQYSSAMDLGRQSTMDMLSLKGQQNQSLQGLADQAFNGQTNLFNMGGQIQQMDMQAAQYDMSRGGGLKGAITGATQGAAAGMQMAQGFGNISNASAMTASNIKLNDAMPAAMKSAAQIGANMSAPAPQQPQAIPFNPAYFNRANFAEGAVNYGTPFGPAFGVGQGPARFAAPSNPSANMYFNPANFAR